MLSDRIKHSIRGKLETWGFNVNWVENLFKLFKKCLKTINIRIIIHDNKNMTLQVFYMLHEIN